MLLQEYSESPKNGVTDQVQLSASRASRLNSPIDQPMSTLLVIDDEPVVRKLACQTLRQAGYTCLEADSALAALEQLQSDRQQLDGMIVDIRLPDMSGLNLVRLARIHRPGTPALFISGYALPAVEEADLQQLLQAFLPKPFTPDQLLAAVREFLPAPQSA
jgi:two-component system cell cycle sensor histidine kinase/response regulator CckA